MGVSYIMKKTNSKEKDMSKLVEEFLKGADLEVSEDISEALIESFRFTSFNNNFLSREEAIKCIKSLPSKLQEQTYGKNSRLYFHASDKPHNPIKESIQPSNTFMCFFANNPESALAVARARHNWNYDFCFLHVCKIKSAIKLFNPQCMSDIKKVSFTQKELGHIQRLNDWLKSGNFSNPRWWRIYEHKSLPSTIKKAGFDGIALNFWDMIHPTPEQEKTEGIAIFNGNQMHVCGIKVVGLKDEIKDRDEYLKDLKIKEELEVEFEAFLKTV